MAKNSISATFKRFITERSHGYCEYCKCSSNFSTEPFSIEHITPRSKQGSDNLENLAHACISCNLYKSDKTEALDVLSQTVVPLFNPRIMQWNVHFTWDESLTEMLGKTAIGRSTIEALKLNRRPVKISEEH